jgi:hypothetical protein
MTDRNLILMISMFAIFALGCSTPMNKPRSPPVTPISEPSHAPRRFRWLPTAIPYSSRYRIDDSSTVSITNDSTGKEVLIISSAVYSLVLTQGEKLTIDLHIDSASTDTAHRQTQPEPHTTATLSTQRQISDLRSTTSTSCRTGMDPRLARLFDLIIPFSPNPATIGSQWADTSSIIICQGKIAFRQHIIRNYKLLAELSQQNRPVIQLQRTTELEMEGVPTDSANLTTANGTGSSTATLLLDRDTGELLESVGTSNLSLSVITSRGIFPFRQHSKLKIKIT